MSNDQQYKGFRYYPPAHQGYSNAFVVFEADERWCWLSVRCFDPETKMVPIAMGVGFMSAKEAYNAALQ